MEDLRHGLSSCDDSALLKAAQIREDGRSEGETDTALISFGPNWREFRLFTQEAARTGTTCTTSSCVAQQSLTEEENI